MMKITAILLLASVLLCNVVRADEEHDHPHDVGVADCPCITTLEYRPVCASNGVTYSSPGALNCAKKCLKRNDLVKVKEGHC